MYNLIRYHHPTFVKHGLAPKNEFGMPKMTRRIYKSFGIRANPPPMLGKIPKKCRFFWTSPLIVHVLESMVLHLDLDRVLGWPGHQRQMGN